MAFARYQWLVVDEEGIYLWRGADGISAGELRALSDNNRMCAGRDTTLLREYHDWALRMK